LANWTLVDGDWVLVANKSGATRLGFSLLLKFFELEGRFPDVLEEVPPAAVEYVADLVKVPPPTSRSTRWSAGLASTTASRSARPWGSGRRRSRTRRRWPNGSPWRSARSSWWRTGSARPCWSSAGPGRSSRQAGPGSRRRGAQGLARGGRRRQGQGRAHPVRAVRSGRAAGRGPSPGDLCRGCGPLRNPEDDLPGDFEATRAVHYAAIRQPLNPRAFIADCGSA
jgi:hypothetical protein